MTAPPDAASYWWELAFRDAGAVGAEDMRRSIARGVEAADRALAHHQDDAQAMLYKSLLLRMQAHLESEQATQAGLFREADRLHTRAALLNKKKTAGL
jgi:hypothetical protein